MPEMPFVQRRAWCGAMALPWRGVILIDGLPALVGQAVNSIIRTHWIADEIIKDLKVREGVRLADTIRERRRRGSRRCIDGDATALSSVRWGRGNNRRGGGAWAGSGESKHA
jgi:hypothetical protein